MNEKIKYDVCLSPALYDFYTLKNNIVVVIDVIRASSTICTAFANGIIEIIPLTEISDALALKSKGYLTAGERESLKVDDFDFGNSPFEFTGAKMLGQKLAFTTTNGTNALRAAKDAKIVVIGTFLNFDTLTQWLINQNLPILILCSGWKNTVSIEDTLFAGKLCSFLKKNNKFEAFSETVSMAEKLWEDAKDNLAPYVIEHSPRLRSKISFLSEEIKYCMSDEQLNVLPVMKDNKITDLAAKIKKELV